MLVRDMLDFPFEPTFAQIKKLLPPDVELYCKIEGFNPAGSIKFKPAVAMIKALEKLGELRAGTRLIETTSGNMGIALSVVAKARGYHFTCVTDDKITTHNRDLISAYGTELIILEGSTHADRCEYIQAKIAEDRNLVWTRQFDNPSNPLSHCQTTATEILENLEKVDYLFVGVGTGGTIAGCARVFRERSPKTRIVAVDPWGSFHFCDNPPSVKRTIPGIGSTQKSTFLDRNDIDVVVQVSEQETIDCCRNVVERSGWLLGGSSGSVVAAAVKLSGRFKSGDIVVAVCADLGERYLDLLFKD